MAPLTPNRSKRPVANKTWSAPTFASYQRQKRINKPEPPAPPEAVAPPSPPSSVNSSVARSESKPVSAKQRRSGSAVAKIHDQTPPVDVERPRKRLRPEASWMRPSLPKPPPPRSRESLHNRNVNDRDKPRSGRRGTEILTGKDLAAQLAAITSDNGAYTPPPRRTKRDVKETKASPVSRRKPPPPMPAWMTPARIDPPPAMAESPASTHKMITRQRATRGDGASSRARSPDIPASTAENGDDDDGLSIAYWKAKIGDVSEEEGWDGDSHAGWGQERMGFNEPEGPGHIDAGFEECFLLDPTLGIEEWPQDDADLDFLQDEVF